MKKTIKKIREIFCHPRRQSIILLLFFLVVTGIGSYFAYLAAPVSSRSDKLHVVVIDKGLTLKEVGIVLQNKGVIKSRFLFTFYAYLVGKEKNVQAGTYCLSDAWSMSRILEQITKGKVFCLRITIPEGYTVSQIERLLAAKGIVDKQRFEEALSMADFNYPFLKGIPQGKYRLEGYLFPATYEVRPGLSEKDIIDLMLKRFQEAFTPELTHRAQELGLSVRDVVILASMVEREAKLDKERPLIAAVFLNRLQRGMRLESCATIQYILGKQKEKLTYEDLRIDSPYNTYLHNGLPPGPISNPGLASIKAVLYPAKVDYLYFVSRGDGSHYFSRTWGEHQMAARHYQNNN